MILLLTLTIACDTSPAPEQLGAGGATLTVPPEGEFEAVSAAGSLAVEGQAADFLFTVTAPDDGTLSFSVVSPSEADLAALHEAEVEVTLLPFGFDERRSLLLSDTRGPRYLLDAGFSAEAVNAALGAERVSFGEEVASSRDGTWETRWTTLRLDTDQGVVELLPGEVVEVTLDGQAWRAAAIAAYDREARPNAALPGCPVLEDMLSYELLRVDAPVEEAFLVRPLDEPSAGLGCL